MSVINEMLRSLDAGDDDFITIDTSGKDNKANSKPHLDESHPIIEEGPFFFRWIALAFFIALLVSMGYWGLRTAPSPLLENKALPVVSSALAEQEVSSAGMEVTETINGATGTSYLNDNKARDEMPVQTIRSVELKPIASTSHQREVDSHIVDSHIVDSRIVDSRKVDGDKVSKSSTLAPPEPLNRSTSVVVNKHQSSVQSAIHHIDHNLETTASTPAYLDKVSSAKETPEKKETILQITPHIQSVGDRLRELQQTAQRALLLSDYHSAESALKAISELRPSDRTHLTDWLSVLLLVDPSKAQTRIDRELALKPDDHLFKQLKANVFIQQQQFTEAYRLLSHPLPPINLYPDYYSLLALSAQQTNQHEAAFQYYSALVQSFPDTGAYYAGAAISADHLQQYSLALPLYTRALQDNRLAEALRTYAMQRRSELLRANL